MTTPRTPDDPERARLAPGEVLAERYRLVARIGRGGMGDVWRADDLVLQTPVALKLLHATSGHSRTRLMNEVRLARQITHPAVCRVFDVGESDGRVFFSMELVEGEDLATLLRRAGRLPVERVIEIGRQLCDGLTAAHAQGVLHRDLKPANVLVDARGRIVITDFGIAVLRSSTPRHTLIGTPGYMAPEQLVAGAALSEQTDLYALGVVLYELIMGHHPSEDGARSDHAVRPSTVIAGISPGLERAILQALSPDPQLRPASAAAMADTIDGDTPAGAGAASRRWLAAAIALGVLAGVALVVLLLSTRGGAGLGAQDTIVLADFANTTGEPVFDGTLKVALAVALEQSPFLKVFADDRVQDTLRLMNRQGGEPISRDTAREIAAREQLKAVIAGAIGGIGAHYIVTLEAIDAVTSDVMAREQSEAGSKEDVLAALGHAATRLREKLGESLASIQRFDVPLPRATTSSLEALHAYAEALDEGRMNPSRESIPQLKRAIDLDPDFALAQAMLSGMYANMGQSALAPELSRRAFQLRDRVSERERFFIAWRYYRDAEQAWDKGLDLARSWTATYPRESLAFNSLGFAMLTLGSFEPSIPPLREAIRLDPKSVAPPENLAGSFIALGRYEDAKAVLSQARLDQRYFIGQAHWSYLIAFIEGQVSEMKRHLDEAVQQPNSVWANDWQARVDAFSGRMAVAHRAFRDGAQAVRRDRLDELAATYVVEDAESHALVGQCEPGRREADEAMALSRDNFTLERASRVLALCGAADRAAALLTELERRLPEAILTTALAIPVTRAILALERGDAAGALTLLEPVRPFDGAPTAEFWPPFLRGRAHLLLKDADGAAREFQRILDRRGEAADRMLYPLAQIGRARAAVLQGDVALARRHYDAFLTEWAEADDRLAPLTDARRERARLP